MTIWVVEDNYLQARDVCDDLGNAFPTGSVNRIKTENEFYERIDEIAEDPKTILVLDIMLRWTEPKRDMPARPERVRKEGYYKAGFRCLEELARRKDPTQIRVILYTVLDEKDIEEDRKKIPEGYKSIRYLAKNAPGSLVAVIKQEFGL